MDIEELTSEENDFKCSLGNEWTPEEDKYLIKLNATSNFKNKWLKISEFIRSKSSSQCRNRYIKLRKFNKNSKLQLGANDKEEHTNNTISIIKDEIPRLFKIVKEPRTSNKPINNNIYESGENINSVQMKEQIRKCSDPDDILAHPNFFELARTNTPDDLPADSNSTERTDNMFQNEYFRTFKNEEDNDKFNHVENELKYILDELSSTNPINTIQEKNDEISLDDMQSIQNNNNLMKTNQIIQSYVEQQKPKNESVICLTDRIKEIENILNSQNFLSLSQQNKMMQYSILLMEINLFSTRTTFNEQEMKLTMGIQSKILQVMIQETQRQLITDDGENMYIKVD